MKFQYFDSYMDEATKKIVDKIVNIKEGLYELETDGTNKWVWTEPEFGGRIKNVTNITLVFKTQIDNELFLYDKKYEICAKTLTTINFYVKDKEEFLIKLKTPYIPAEFEESEDTRELGVYLISMKVDGIDLF
jgi:hypothetical protein